MIGIVFMDMQCTASICFKKGYRKTSARVNPER